MSAVIEDSTPVLRPVPLAAGAGSRTIAFDANGSIPLERFLGQVRALAALLPDGQHAINLCEDRYHFMLAFCAVALRGQVTLLPSSRAPGDIAEVASRHPDCYCLGDCAIAPTPPRYWRLPDTLVEMAGEPPNTGLGALVAIGFTSGSTGAPTANNKHWGSLCTSTSQNLAALRDLWPVGDTAQIVATVPPQHMYGMELSVLLPLLGDVAVHTGRPFFPHDILQALAEV
ncbi:MAG: AMP-ligase, partial [Luteimonas sp.]